MSIDLQSDRFAVAVAPQTDYHRTCLACGVALSTPRIVERRGLFGTGHQSFGGALPGKDRGAANAQ